MPELNSVSYIQKELNVAKHRLSTLREKNEVLLNDIRRLQVEISIEKDEMLSSQREFALSLEKNSFKEFLKANKFNIGSLKNGINCFKLHSNEQNAIKRSLEK